MPFIISKSNARLYFLKVTEILENKFVLFVLVTKNVGHEHAAGQGKAEADVNDR